MIPKNLCAFVGTSCRSKACQTTESLQSSNIWQPLAELWYIVVRRCVVSHLWLIFGSSILQLDLPASIDTALVLICPAQRCPASLIDDKLFRICCQHFQQLLGWNLGANATVASEHAGQRDIWKTMGNHGKSGTHDRIIPDMTGKRLAACTAACWASPSKPNAVNLAARSQTVTCQSANTICRC